MSEIYFHKDQTQNLELMISCLGYEKRSTYILEHYYKNFVGEKIVFDYKSEGVFSYDENLEIVTAHDCSVIENFPHMINFIDVHLKEKKKLTISLDITSLDRAKLAALISFFFSRRESIKSLQFVYAPSKFKKPKFSFDVVNAFGPVVPAFMGNTQFLREKLTLIAGVGYEYGRIIGAIDTLEPQNVHCFMPIGTDRQYEAAILQANDDFNFLEDRDSLIKYDLHDTFSLFYDLRRVIEEENSRNNVMILPLGPKIFAAISITIAMILHPNIMVWRHSTANVSRLNSIAEATASGKIVKFEFSF